MLDPTHRLDALFGVVNIPSVVWIDEQGIIVRPPEPGWPGGRTELPKNMMESIPKLGRAPGAPKRPDANANPLTAIAAGQDRESYPDAIRDWVDKGADSIYAMSPDEVVAHSQPRPMSKSEGAAQFELATYLWRTGQRDSAIAHFAECHRLQPDNWTYKRQAWSLVGNQRVGGEFGRFAQGPLEGEEAEWPFPSDFWSDISLLDEGAYYPKTM